MIFLIIFNPHMIDITFLLSFITDRDSLFDIQTLKIMKKKIVRNLQYLFLIRYENDFNYIHNNF